MDKLILHIGPHKTGSTYIQKSFYDNADVLAKQGIYYPTVDWVVQDGHHFGHSIAAKDENFESFVNYINSFDGKGQFKSLLISSENFDRWSKDQVRKFRSEVNVPIVLVYFYREPLGMMYSHWQERVKFGYERLFANFIIDHISDPFNSRILNPGIILQNWCKNDVEESPVLIDYDSVIKNGGNIVHKFIQQVFTSEFTLKLQDRLMNPSFELSVMEILRVMNAIDKSKGLHPSAGIARAFFKIRNEREIISLMRQAINNNSVTINVQSRSTLIEVYKDFEMKFPGLFSQISFELIDKELVYVNPNWIFGVEEQLYELHSECRDILNSERR